MSFSVETNEVDVIFSPNNQHIIGNLIVFKTGDQIWVNRNKTVAYLWEEKLWKTTGSTMKLWL